MTKLSDTQAIILSAAAQRSGGNLLPLPGSLRGGAALKVVGALLSRGLACEEVIDRTIPADTALNTVWRNEADGRAVLLRITPDGLAAIGVEPADEAATPVEPEAAPGGGAVSYRINEGTKSAGEPAAGPAATPDAPKKRGRPKKAAAEPAAPAALRKTRDDTKQAQLIAMLRRKEGATIAQIVAATGWQPHTVRGAFAGDHRSAAGAVRCGRRLARRARRAPQDRRVGSQRRSVLDRRSARDGGSSLNQGPAAHRSAQSRHDELQQERCRARDVLCETRGGDHR